jgi:nitroreductase
MVISTIKKRATARSYLKKRIPKDKIEKIVDAGVWGPSVPSFLRIQPWKFVVIRKKRVISAVAGILREKARRSGSSVNLMLGATAKIISKADFIILVYNSNDLRDIRRKYKNIYSHFAKIITHAQTCAISAAVQNMLLAAESLGVGSCWLDNPLFCSKEINALVKQDDELFAVLTFGYSSDRQARSQRKPREEMVQYIDEK